MRKSLWAAFAALCVSQAPVSSAAASELRISFGDSSLRGEYLQAIGKAVADSAPTLQAGVLYHEKDNADGTLGHLGLVIYGDAGARNAIVQVGIGGRVFLLSTDYADDSKGVALAMGGALAGRLPGIDRLGVFGGLWFAPQVSSFGDIDNAFEANIGVEYQLLRQAAISAGWRHIKFKIADYKQSLELESSAFVGFKFLF